MKKNKKFLKNRVEYRYEAPRIKVQKVALEYSISAGSVQHSITESWDTETQTKDINW